MKKYNIKISKLALNTLSENILFLKSFNTKYSLKIRDTIIKGIDSLTIFPYSHFIYKKTDSYIYRKLTIKRRYNIIYTIDNNTIIIFYISDCRRAKDKHFKSLK